MRLGPAICALAIALAVAACNASGEVDPGLLTSVSTVVAHDVAFEQTMVIVPAGRAFTLTLDNRDSGIPHGLQVSRDDAVVATSEIIVGPGKVSVSLPALAGGSYTFICPVHPNMTGALLARP